MTGQPPKPPAKVPAKVPAKAPAGDRLPGNEEHESEQEESEQEGVGKNTEEGETAGNQEKVPGNKERLLMEPEPIQSLRQTYPLKNFTLTTDHPEQLAHLEAGGYWEVQAGAGTSFSKPEWVGHLA
jgi:hypothetical protein